MEIDGAIGIMELWHFASNPSMARGQAPVSRLEGSSYRPHPLRRQLHGCGWPSQLHGSRSEPNHIACSYFGERPRGYQTFGLTCN